MKKIFAIVLLLATGYSINSMADHLPMPVGAASDVVGADCDTYLPPAYAYPVAPPVYGRPWGRPWGHPAWGRPGRGVPLLLPPWGFGLGGLNRAQRNYANAWLLGRLLNR
jgi:hypothetical protein